MIPFCGYNMADYFAHWMAMGAGTLPEANKTPPKIFHVNWFRKGTDGKFLWPGFGENLRVLQWILARCRGKGEALETPIGHIPATGGLDVSGLNLPQETMEQLLRVDAAAWAHETPNYRSSTREFGQRLPAEITRQHDEQKRRLAEAR